MRDTSRQPVSRARQARERKGRLAELAAAAALVLSGHRVLAWRHRTRHGEIDLVALRGRRLVFAEVKARRTWPEGQVAIEAMDAHRLWDAAEAWLVTRPRYRTLERGFDAIIVIPWHWPRHLPNALQPLY